MSPAHKQLKGIQRRLPLQPLSYAVLREGVLRQRVAAVVRLHREYQNQVDACAKFLEKDLKRLAELVGVDNEFEDATPDTVQHLIKLHLEQRNQKGT